VNVCTGGRKKKLNASIDATETGTAYASPQATATPSTGSVYSTPRLTSGATGTSAHTTSDIAATADAQTPTRSARALMARR
jgi:hypothetical protein